MRRSGASREVPIRMSVLLVARESFARLFGRDPAGVEFVEVAGQLVSGELPQQLLTIGKRRWRGSKEGLDGFIDRRVHRSSWVNGMGETDSKGHVYVKARAVQEVATQKTCAEGGQQDRHQLDRRETETHFGNSEECLRRCEQNVTRCGERKSRADADGARTLKDERVSIRMKECVSNDDISGRQV